MHNRSHSIEQAGEPSKPAAELLPVLSVLLAATLWGVFWYPLRLLEDMGLHGLWSTLLIYCGTLPVALVMMRGRIGELAREPLALMVLVLAAGWTNTAFILAMLDGNVLRVLLLFFLSPIWATLMGWRILGERISARAIVTLVIALAGAIVMLWAPGLGTVGISGADWMALSAGIGFALMNTMVRKIQRVSIQVKTTAAWIGGIVFAGTWLVVAQVPLAPAGNAAVSAALIFGLLVMVLMTLSVQYGVTHMPVHRSAVIMLFELVAGAVSAQILASEYVAPREWIGGGLIVAAAYLSARRNLEDRHG